MSDLAERTWESEFALPSDSGEFDSLAVEPDAAIWQEEEQTVEGGWGVRVTPQALERAQANQLAQLALSSQRIAVRSYERRYGPAKTEMRPVTRNILQLIALSRPDAD